MRSEDDESFRLLILEISVLLLGFVSLVVCYGWCWCWFCVGMLLLTTLGVEWLGGCLVMRSVLDVLRLNASMHLSSQRCSHNIFLVLIIR